MGRGSGLGIEAVGVLSDAVLGRFFRRLALDFLDLGLQLRGRRRGVGLFVGEALLQGGDSRLSGAGFLRLRLELVLQRFDMDAKRGDFLPLRLRGAEGLRRLDLGGIGEGRPEIAGDLVGRGPAHAERQQQRAGGGGVEARLARAAMDRREFDFRRLAPEGVLVSVPGRSGSPLGLRHRV